MRAQGELAEQMSLDNKVIGEWPDWVKRAYTVQTGESAVQNTTQTNKVADILPLETNSKLGA